MTANRKRSTYRLTPDLDRAISEKAKAEGLTKNAWVQTILSRVINGELKPTGTV